MSATDNVNEVRIIWSDIRCEFLIDQRIARNRYFFSYFAQNYFICYNKNGFFTKILNFSEFWSLSLRRQITFWQSVADNLNECFQMHFTAVQVRTKWNNISQLHRVSIYYYIIIQYIY